MTGDTCRYCVKVEKCEKSLSLDQGVQECEDFIEYHFSDLGNAQRLRVEFGENFRYSYSDKSWFTWNRNIWNIDKGAHMERYARQTIKKMYTDASKTSDYEEKKKLVEFALRTESAKGIENMLKLAKSEPGIPILPEVFDTDKMLFNVQNGTIDLRTGKIRDHNRNDYITKISPVVYDPNATCPTWEAFLEKIFDGNKGIIEYQQRKCGYRMTGETKEEDFDINYGTGQNGKSKYFDEIVYIMGDYHKKINVETIQEATTHKDGNAASSDVACLKGIRFVTVSEPEKGMKLDESKIKDWTGRDKITARHLYSEPFDFYPEFKIDLYTNHKPIIKSQGIDMWRRIKLVPFSVTISDEEKDTNLGEKLKKESAGILNWMIKGCLMWQKDGLKVPEEILQATAEYKEDQDYLGDFFKECCEIGKDYKVPFKWIHLTYRAYCEVMDMPAQSHITFAETLINRNYKVKHTGKGNIYTGIRLKVKVEEKCHEINSASEGLRSEGVKVMRVFLETFINQFSYGDLVTKPPQPPQPSQNEPIDNEKEITPENTNLHKPSLSDEKHCGICGEPLNGNSETFGFGLGSIHPSCKFIPIELKVVANVPKFVGRDHREYGELLPGQIVAIPASNAYALINRKVAIRNEV